MIKPNTLTTLRIILAVVLCFVLSVANHFLSYLLCFTLFVVAALTDLWDGQLARKHKLESNFGKIADPIADKILILGTFFTLAARHVYSVWWIVPVAVREVVVTLVRLKKLSRHEVIAAEWSGKLKTVIQIVTLGISFVVFILQNTGNGEPFLIRRLMFACLIATNVIAIYSGVDFFRRLQTK